MLNSIERVLASVLTERCAIGQILILRKNKMGFAVLHRDNESRAEPGKSFETQRTPLRSRGTTTPETIGR